MAVAEITLEAELARVGIRLTSEEFGEIVLEALRQMPTVITSDDPTRELTEAERDALIRGGGIVGEPPADMPDPHAKTIAKFAALLATSYKVDEVATMLGVDPSRIRQRLKERSLYGVKTTQGWRIPRFQFDGRQLIPNVDQVIAAMPADMDLIGFYNWFTLPDPDFWIDEVSVSPSKWLRSGGDPTHVVALAASFHHPL
jgi:hypothetical protein